MAVAPRRGDVIAVDWLDIHEDPCGDPATATLAKRTSYGLFWERREDCGVDAVITTTTLDEGVQNQNGFCIYPIGCIRKITIIKRARKRR